MDIDMILDDIVNKISDSTSQFVIWGCDEYTEEFYERYKKYISILGVVVAERDSHNSHGYPNAYSPDEIWSRLKDFHIIIAAKRTEDLKKIESGLIRHGWERNVDYYYAKFFESVYGAYKLDKAILNYAEISITERCTLKCKNCSLFMPYYENPVHMSLQELLNDVDTFFRGIDYVFHFRLLGGETFLHPELAPLLDYIVSQYRDKIDYFDIATNGTIIPNSSLLDICRDGNIVIAISDYSINKEYEAKVERLIDLLHTRGLHFCRTRYTNWYDLGFPSCLSEGCTEEQKKEMFSACKAEWRSFYKGSLYFCSVCASAQRSGMIKGIHEDKFVFSNSIDKQALLRFNLGINAVGYNSLCGLCQGYMPSANRCFVKAGVQFSRDDIIKIRHH